MDRDAPDALTAAPDAAARLAGGALALAWWALLGTLVYVCFLRDEPRSLAATLAWFGDPPPWLVGIAAVLLLAGVVEALRGRGPLGVTSALAALLLGLNGALQGF